MLLTLLNAFSTYLLQVIPIKTGPKQKKKKKAKKKRKKNE